MCGADIASLDERARRRGSSPPVRSRPRAAGTPTRRSGIISACAEQTRRAITRLRLTWDHLRVCGADQWDRTITQLDAGSSPRVRSRLLDGLQVAALRGIISACAEQTGRSRRPRHDAGDHLRVCGADIADRFQFLGDGGSSPRVRSRRPERGISRRGQRIISACAEQTAIVIPR